MTMIKRWVVSAAIALAIVFASAAARLQAQVLRQIPSDALVVLKVNNLKATSDKLAKFSQDLGLVAVQPALADPLAMGMGMLRLQQGLNPNGEFAVAYMDPALVGGDNEKAVLIFVPITDYRGMLANDPNAKTEGEITSITVANEPMFAANWGQYAVLSPAKELLSHKPSGAGLVAPAATAKELAAKDAILYANFSALRVKLLPSLQQARVAISGEMDRGLATAGPQFAKFAPLIKAAVGQAFVIAEGFLNEAQAASVGMMLVPEGLNLTVMAEFKAGGYTAQNITSSPNTDASLLAGLPDGKYLMYGGGLSDSQRGVKVLTDLLDPIVKEVLAVGPEMAPVKDYFDAIKAQVAVTKGQSFGVLAPSGALGAESIIQLIAIQRGDSKALKDATAKQTDAQNRFIKALNLPVPGLEAMMPSHTPNAKTIDGVSFDSITTNIAAANPQSPMARQQAEAMKMVYGPQGMVINFGAISSDKALMVMGVSDQVIKSAIASAKSNAVTLENSEGYKEVVGQLPKQRVAVVFVDVAQIATTTLSYMKQFGFAMPVQLPPGLPPIAVAVSTEQGTAMRVDVHVPKTLVQSMVAAGMQAAMQMQGGGPGGPRGGGL